MTKFKVGEKYSMFSPCQYSCTWEYEVVKRTAKSEYCYPLGRYSMCPVLRAGR